MEKIDGKPLFKLFNRIIEDFGFNKKDFLHINCSNFFEKDFEFGGKKYSVEIENHQTALNELNNEKFNKKFKLVFGDFPFGIRPDQRELSIQCLKFLEPKGIGIFLMPNFLLTFKNNSRFNYLQKLNEEGYKVLSILQLPEDYLLPISGIQSTLVFLSKENKIDKTYFAKYQDMEFQPHMISFGISQVYDEDLRSDDPMNGLSLNEINEIKREENLFDGVELKINNFHSFEYWEQDKEIANLDSEYGGYEYVKLNDIAVINSTRDVFEDHETALYIPAIGKTEVLNLMPTLLSKKKPQNYFQVIPDTSIILEKYLFIFLNSELGQKTIERELSKYSEATISRLRVSDIKNLYIPLPSLEIQEEIDENISKLKKITELLTVIEKDLSLKPISSSQQLAKLNQIYESSLELTEPEIVFNDIKKGESVEREFKQTFALDIQTKQKENYIVESCIKSIAGFMNSNGGTLYVGVDDSGEITGNQVEVGSNKIYKNYDKYLVAIKNILEKRIGNASLQNCEFESVEIRGKKILKIFNKKSDHQVWVDGKLFYLRQGPTTNLLEGPDLVTFSKERFN
tara:strand:+ start:109 stop:1818 length:1710 start_codon:yes stop_codon:yes gene_type:complete